jgi:parvulin-like peptidyl-prolyl isomerase
MTQAQKEAMYQRWLYIGLAVAAGLIVLALGAGAIWQYQIMPNQVLATVNGDEITRRDYWKYQEISLYNQARLYENMAKEFTGQEQSQFLLYSTQLDAARGDVEGSTDVSDATLAQMIEDKLYVQAAEEQGVDMSPPVLKQTALNTWAPTGSPLVTPIPSPTMIPQRAEWATSTAEAMQTQQAEQSLMLGTPVAATPVIGTPTAATPVTGTTLASPVASPVMGTPSATPDMAVVQANAESDYQTFLTDVLADTGLSEEEYLELFAKPQVAREHVNANIVASVPQSASQVEVSHIMVNTEELANEVYADVSNGTQTFEDAAAIWSQDTASSSNGGQLGWVTEGQLPDEIDAVVFDMQPGDISQPIQSPFGWHIVTVTGKEDDRALTTNQYDAKVLEARTAFLEEQRAKNDISSDYYDPTPAPTAAVFTPPMDAPTPIVATPVTAPDLSATPISGPVLAPASPEASPATSPQASPQAPGAASQEASPDATP